MRHWGCFFWGKWKTCRKTALGFWVYVCIANGIMYEMSFWLEFSSSKERYTHFSLFFWCRLWWGIFGYFNFVLLILFLVDEYDCDSWLLLRCQDLRQRFPPLTHFSCSLLCLVVIICPLWFVSWIFFHSWAAGDICILVLCYVFCVLVMWLTWTFVSWRSYEFLPYFCEWVFEWMTDALLSALCRVQ